MQRLHVLLRGTRHRDRGDAAAGHRTADRLCIGHIALVGPHKRFDVLRRQNTYVVAQTHQLARPVVRTTAGLDANPSRRCVGEPAQHLPSRQALAHHHLAVRIFTMNLEHVLCQIQAYRSSLHMLLPSTVRWLMNRFQLGTHDAASEVGGAHTIIPAKAGIQ